MELELTPDEDAILDLAPKRGCGGGSCGSRLEPNKYKTSDAYRRQVPDTPVDNVNHPFHYTSHPSGIECIQVTEHMGFCPGNAIKYIWRAALKNDPIENYQKAIWYLNREIERLKNEGR